MVKDHSDSERRNPLPPHGLLFTINSKGSFIETQAGLHIPRPLLHQSWSTGWNEKKKEITHCPGKTAHYDSVFITWFQIALVTSRISVIVLTVSRIVHTMGYFDITKPTWLQ